MIPVFQTRTGMTGNCFAACLASIMEIGLQTIPEFTDERFLTQLADWLQTFDLFYVQVKPDDPVLKAMFRFGQAWHTIEGISPRGGLHACVGLNGKLIHDPHVGGNGLVNVKCFGLLCRRSAISAGPNSRRYL